MNRPLVGAISKLHLLFVKIILYYLPFMAGYPRFSATSNAFRFLNVLDFEKLVKLSM